MKTIFYSIVIYDSKNFQSECSSLSMVKGLDQHTQKGVWIKCEDNTLETDKQVVDAVIQKFAIKLGVAPEKAMLFVAFDEDRTGHIKTS